MEGNEEGKRKIKELSTVGTLKISNFRSAQQGFILFIIFKLFFLPPIFGLKY